MQASAILGTAGDPAGELEVQVSGAVVTDPRGLVAGDVLAVGIGPATPYGLLRRVEEVRDAGDGSFVLATGPAALEEAIPQGGLAFSGLLEPEPMALGASDLSATETSNDGGGGVTRARGALEGGDMPAQLQWSLDNLKCRNDKGNAVSFEAKFKLEQHLTPSFDFALDWTGDEPPTGHATVGLSGTGKLTLTATGAVNCSLTGPVLAERRLRPIAFLVAGVPVVVVPTVLVDAKLSLGAAEQVEVQVATAGALGAPGSTTATVTFGPDDVTGTGTFDWTATLSGSLHATVTGSVAITPRFKALFYGVFGPEVSLTSTVEAVLQPCQTPWWKVGLKPEKVGLKLDFAKWLGKGAKSLSKDISLGAGVPLAQGDPQTPPVDCGSIQPAALVPFQVGVPVDERLWVDETLAASGIITWTVQAGALPLGVNAVLDADGVSLHLEGTPLETGSFQFTIQATDAFGHVLTRTYGLSVVSAPLAFTTTSLPDADLDEPYSQTIATNATDPVVFSLVDGALPPGLTLGANGLVSGVPGQLGVYSFVVQVAVPDGTESVRQGFVIGVDSNFVLDVKFPSTIPSATGTPLDVTLRVPVGDGTYLPVAGRIIQVAPTCATVNDSGGTTDANGRFQTVVTPSAGCDNVSVKVSARLELDGPDVTRAVTVMAAVARSTGVTVGSADCFVRGMVDFWNPTLGVPLRACNYQTSVGGLNAVVEETLVGDLATATNIQRIHIRADVSCDNSSGRTELLSAVTRHYQLMFKAPVKMSVSWHASIAGNLLVDEGMWSSRVGYGYPLSKFGGTGGFLDAQGLQVLDPLLSTDGLAGPDFTMTRELVAWPGGLFNAVFDVQAHCSQGGTAHATGEVDVVFTPAD